MTKTIPASVQIASELTVHAKYARFIPELQRRETWDDIVDRSVAMHCRKYPELKHAIRTAYDMVRDKLILPSMRGLQFAGTPIDLAPNRIFNCAYRPADTITVFNEAMFLLLGGTGLGYSVQRRHVGKLPAIHRPSGSRRYLVQDSIEGWADAVKELVESYFIPGRKAVRFDFRDVREKGAPLITSGGKAPGPEPLKKCLDGVRGVLDRAIDDHAAAEALFGSSHHCIVPCYLRPIEVHDMLCHIAEAVRAGGIRRAALISLFDKDDDEMLRCKSGAWWEDNPQRGRANNSVVLVRGEVSEGEFAALWQAGKDSGCGEPGFYWTNDPDYGCNPCCEISLKPYQFCNLTEVNVSGIATQDELNARVRAATFIATLQAGYTDFHYLGDQWKDTTDEEALVGVGLTGICSGAVLALDLEEAAQVALDTNAEVAAQIGVNPAARVTTIKPAGTTSLVMGCSSGVHAWHWGHFIRRIRLGRNEAVAQYLMKHHAALVEDDQMDANQVIVALPMQAPEGAILRDEPAMATLERVKKFNTEWVRAGHRSGPNTNNVSCTISLKEEEWVDVGEWMYNNRDTYNGISVLPFDGGTYVQAPFEDITAEQFNEMVGSMHAIDLSKVVELEDATDLTGEVACGGGACEVR